MRESAPFDVPAALGSAERLLTDHFNCEIHLKEAARFDSPHLVLRVEVTGDGDDLPETVILKQLRAGEGDDDPQYAMFRNEWAALQFLSDFATDAPLVSRLYAGDSEARLMVIEDLGARPTVQGMLYGVDEAAGFGDDATGGTGAAASNSGVDASAVEAALLRYGTYLGQLHAVTAGHEARFRAIQTGLDASSPLCDSTLDLSDRMDVIHKGLAFLEITPPPGFDGEIDRMEAALHAPDSPFRTLIHGDSGPQNMMALGERTLLLDFAFADYRHALLDVVSARLAFPHAFRAMRLPDRIVDGLEGAYREAVVRAIPQAGDDAAYGRELCYAAAHWSVGRLTAMLRRLVDLAERGESIEEAGGHMREEVAALLGQPTTRIFDWYRRGVVTGLDATLALPGTGVHLAAMAQVMDAARGQIVARWPETEGLPLYPVFRDAAADAVK